MPMPGFTADRALYDGDRRYRATPTSSQRQGLRPAADFECEREGDLLPHPTDCGKFIHCSHGVGYIKDCPSILHFNPTLLVCDWPEKAGCERW